MIVRKNLYDSKWPTSFSLIKRDLEYISNCYMNKCFDLWEEIYGLHFYTLCVQKEALLKGSKLAQRLGDEGAYNHYIIISNEIEKIICERFYVDMMIRSSVDINDGERLYDSSVLLGFIHSNRKFDVELANTMAKQVDIFRREYQINSENSFHTESTEKLMLIGRYAGDHYYGGNPWVLTSASLAYFLNTFDLEAIDKSLLSDEFYKIFGSTNESLRKHGHSIIDTLMCVQRMNNGLKSKRSFSEQIDRYTGHYISADRLTWNYVEILRAVNQSI
jgi:glucoamylase